jgi:uncharacterized protein
VTDTETTSREITRRIVEALAPDRIYLFGSRARGNARPDSDWDVLVVVNASLMPGHRRDAVALRALRGLRASVDVLVLTREEFEGRLDVVCSLPATVAREGKLIYAAA